MLRGYHAARHHENPALFSAQHQSHLSTHQPINSHRQFVSLADPLTLMTTRWSEASSATVSAGYVSSWWRMLCATAVTNTIGFRSRSSQSTSANCSGVIRVSGRCGGDVEGQGEVMVEASNGGGVWCWLGRWDCD